MLACFYATGRYVADCELWYTPWATESSAVLIAQTREVGEVPYIVQQRWPWWLVGELLLLVIVDNNLTGELLCFYVLYSETECILWVLSHSIFLYCGCVEQLCVIVNWV